MKIDERISAKFSVEDYVFGINDLEILLPQRYEVGIVVNFGGEDTSHSRDETLPSPGNLEFEMINCGSSLKYTGERNRNS